MCLQELVTLDPSKSADLVVFHFTEEVQQIISELQVRSQYIYSILSIMLALEIRVEYQLPNFIKKWNLNCLDQHLV